MTIQNPINEISERLPEIDLLLCCARVGLSDKQIKSAKEILEKKVDWNLLTKLSFRHGVVPLVYRNLNTHFSEHVPDANKAILRDYVMASTQSNLGLLKELFNIIALLKKHNIQCIPFKGLMVAELIYHNLSARKCGDIDVLLKQDDFYKAKNLFLSQGFQQTLSDKAEIDYLQSGLFHESRKINLDLHYGLPPKAVEIKAAKLFKNVANFSIKNESISTLSETDMLLVLCVNATKEYWNQKLYTYCDIQTFLEKYKHIDWDIVIKRANALRCKRMMFTALLVCQEVYGVPDSPYILNKIHSIDEIIPIKNELIQQLLPRDVVNFKSVRGKFCYLDSEKEFFTRLMDTKIIRMKFRLPKSLRLNERDFAFVQLPRKLFFLHYLIKPFRVIHKRSWELFGKILS